MLVMMDPFAKGFADRATNIAGILLGVSVGVLIFNCVHSYFRLRHIPGPTLAALTNLARRSWVVAGDVHQKHTDLHRRYGTVVRVGPNAVLISQPAAIDKIYGFKTRLLKVRQETTRENCVPFCLRY